MTSTQSPQPAIEGRIVHVFQPTLGHCQPAIVVRSWGDGTGALNLHVFPDGTNDSPAGFGGEGYWATSVGFMALDERVSRDEPRSPTWHWPTDHK